MIIVLVALTGCGADDQETAMPTGGTNTPILLFTGAGTSPNDVNAFKKILDDSHLNYATANSSQLNRMAQSQLEGYRLLIVPGGNFIDIGNGLTSSTTVNVHNAVQNGLNYFGICAGAFMAGNIRNYKSFNLTSGVRFPFYSAENRGIHKAAVPIAVAGAPTLDQYWEDGPELTGWGTVVGKYPEGTSAIIEGKVGNGWVILSGVHTEAPANWRYGMTFTTPLDADTKYTLTLIDAALNRTELPHY